jgi:hypothetical protein
MVVVEGRERHPGVRLVAKAVCSFPGEEPRRLFATSLTERGAFILCMRPPALGFTLTVDLFLPKRNPLSSAEARVIGVRIDPAIAELSGFEVVFTKMADSALEELSDALAGLEPIALVRPLGQGRNGHELRRHPRVETSVAGVINLEEPLHVDVANLSISGALLALGEQPMPDSLQPGTEISLNLLLPDIPENLGVRAEVVRITGASEPLGIGVRFLDLDPLVELRLEGLIIGALVGPSVEYRHWPAD